MKKSIYEIQNPVDFSPYTHEYLIQALANMGQRIGVKGDGIQYGYFKFTDIINTEEYDPEKYIGTVKYDTVISGETNILGAYFGVIEKGLLYNKTNNLISPDSPYYLNTDIRNIIRLKHQLQFDIPINNIEKYSPNSLIHNDGKLLTTILIGKYFGYDDTDNNNAEIIYNKFDIKTGMLVYAVRAMYLYSDNANDYYLILRTVYKDSQYKMTVQIYNPKYLGNYSDEFRHAFCFSNYIDKEFTIFNILRDDISSDYIKLDNLEAYGDNEYVDTAESFDNISIVDMMFHTAANNAVYNQIDININYNKDNENNIFSIGDDQQTILNEKYLKNNFNININDYIELLDNDVISLYYKLLKYYNSNYYFADKRTLSTRIICKLYEKVADIDIDNEAMEYNTMYIPLDMEFTYASSSVNELNIYYSNNMFITVTDLSSDTSSTDINEFFNINKSIVFDYDDVSKIKSYAFQIKYNSIYNDIADYIDVVNLYTMPYITQYNTWSVNDNDTGVPATGNDAGNPNIIILYTKNDSVTVLSSFANFTDINPTYSKRIFYVNPNMFHNNISGTNIECSAYIPDITSVNSKYFNNSLIISLSSISNINDTALQSEYIGNYVMSLWKIDNDEYKFNYIVDPLSQDNYDIALTLDNMSSVFAQITNNDIISGAVLKLKARVYKLAQEADTGTGYNWMLMRVKPSDEYNTEIGIENNDDTDKYQNDLNIILQVNKTLLTVGNVIKTDSNDPKYITFGENNTIPVSYITNLIYPKYVTQYDTIEETHEIVTPGTDADNIYYIDTDNYGDVVMSVEQLSNINNAIDERHDTEVVTKTVSKSYLSNVDFYNEYVFNSDVPTFDLREVMLRNINVMNRVNIMSLDDNGHIYNAYFGTSFDENDKSTLHIGTSSSNINIGTSTLISNDDKYTKFDVHDKLSVDFNNIDINSKMFTSPVNLVKKEIDGNIYYTANIRPAGKLSNHGLYAYTWDYMTKRYSDAQGEFGTVIGKYNDNYYALNNIADINPNNKLYICGKSNEAPALQIISAENDKNDSNILFRRLYIYADAQETVNELINKYNNKTVYIPEKFGSTLVFIPKSLSELSVRTYNIGEIVDTGLTNVNVLIQPVTPGQSASYDNGTIYAKKHGLSVVSTGIISYLLYSKYDIDPVTGTFIYGYNTIDIYNMMKYIFNIDLSEYSSVNINTGNNTLITYTDKTRKYWYLIINDDIYDNISFESNDAADFNNINILNDNLNIVLWFNDGEINIDIKFTTTNRPEKIGYYISEPTKDSIFDKQSI